MRRTMSVIPGALSALLLFPAGAAAEPPDAQADTTAIAATFTATINAKAWSRKRKTNVKVGAVDVPAGTTVNRYCLQLSSTPVPTKGSCTTGWKILPTNFVVADQDGEQTIFVWARATGGVISARGSDTMFLDRALPVTTFDVVQTVAGSRVVDVTWPSYSDPGESDSPPTGSGIVKWAVVNGTTPPIRSSKAWKDAPQATHKVTKGNGTKTVSAFVRDRAGNISLAATDTVELALAGPTLTLTIPPYTNTQRIPITLDATDNSGSGIAGYLVKENTNTPTLSSPGWKIFPTRKLLSDGTGVKTLYAWVKDNNGSISPVASDTTTWDVTPPTGSFSFDDATTTTRTVDVTIVIPADAPGEAPVTHWALKNGTSAPTLNSDWKAYPANTPPTTYELSSGNGTKTVSLFVKDAAGNVSAAITDTIVLTQAPPTITNFTLPPGITKTLTTAVSISASVSSGSPRFCVQETTTPPTGSSCPTGWKVAISNFTMSAGEGSRTLYAWAKDGNNVVSSMATASTFVDTVAPSVNLTVTNDGTACVAMGGSASDAGGSGVEYWAVRKGTDEPPYPQNSIWKSAFGTASATIALTDGVTETVTLWVRDAAGNLGSDTESVTLDTGVTCPA